MLSIVLLFLKSYWKHIIIVIVLASASYYVYHKIYARGYAVASAECSIRIADYEKKMKVYQDAMDARIAVLQDASNVLVKEAIDSRVTRKAEITAILAAVKGKPMYVVKENKCAPSPEFINAYNAAVEKVNRP
jgi:hypothetical protein